MTDSIQKDSCPICEHLNDFKAWAEVVTYHTDSYWPYSFKEVDLTWLFGKENKTNDQ